MKMDNILEGLQKVAPDVYKKFMETEGAKKSRMGNKMISLSFPDGQTLFFLYNNENNWNLGTKPWRMKPIVNSKEEE